MHDRHHPYLALALLAVACLAGATGLSPAHAEDASPWAADAHSQVRLIAGSNAPGQPKLRAGIDLALAQGWHTYWRYPGDSGVPPRFDFKGSRNVKSVQVLWPAPQRIVDAGGQSIGYHGRVIMPLRVTPADPAQPVLLTLNLSYAICEKLCVPAEAAAELSLAPADSSQDAALTEAEARVPKPVAIGASGPLSITAVRREEGGGKPRVLVTVAAPSGEPVDLFAEGPTPEWALPLPESKSEATAGQRQFVFELDGAPPDAKVEGAELTLTLVAGQRAVEATSRLD